MATTSDSTGILAKATSTTEGRLAIAGVVGGLLVQLAGYLIPLLNKAAAANPNSFRLQMASIIAGAASVGISVGTFAFSRAGLKAAALQFLSGLAAQEPVLFQLAVQHYFPGMSAELIAANQTITKAITSAVQQAPPSSTPAAP